MLTYSCILHMLPCTRCAQVPQSSAAAAAAADAAVADAAEVEFEVQTEPAPPWQACLSYAEGETVYDVAWYPGMSSAEPASCCFVSTARDHPVHLWCAYTGTLRGTAVHDSVILIILVVAYLANISTHCSSFVDHSWQSSKLSTCVHGSVVASQLHVYDCTQLQQ
jgi:hypothetical protein